MPGSWLLPAHSRPAVLPSWHLHVLFPLPGMLFFQIPTSLFYYLFCFCANCEAHPNLLPTPLITLPYFAFSVATNSSKLWYNLLVYFMCCLSLYDSLPLNILRAGVSVCLFHFSILNTKARAWFIVDSKYWGKREGRKQGREERSKEWRVRGKEKRKSGRETGREEGAI